MTFFEVARDYLVSVIKNPDSYTKDAVFRVAAHGFILTADKAGWMIDGGPSQQRYAAPLTNLQAAVIYLQSDVASNSAVDGLSKSEVDDEVSVEWPKCGFCPFPLGSNSGCPECVSSLCRNAWIASAKWEADKDTEHAAQAKLIAQLEANNIAAGHEIDGLQQHLSKARAERDKLEVECDVLRAERITMRATLVEQWRTLKNRADSRMKTCGQDGLQMQFESEAGQLLLALRAAGIEP